jgi:hypothetical protein
MGAPKLGQEKLTPRDPSARAERAGELRRLYVDENMTTIEIGQLFNVKHRSVVSALKKFGIPARKVGVSRYETCREPECQLPIYRIRHKGNGSWYGSKCRLHWIIHRMKLSQEYNDKHLGKDDEAWLRRLRQLLARVRRMNHEVSQSLKVASPPETTSPDA